MRLFIQSVEEKKTTAGKPFFILKTDQGEFSAWDGKFYSGTAIDAQVKENGKYKNIVASKLLENDNAPPAPSNGHSQVAIPWYMNFVSNICAHAIDKGLVTDAASLREWAFNAASAAEAVASGDVPF